MVASGDVLNAPSRFLRHLVGRGSWVRYQECDSFRRLFAHSSNYDMELTLDYNIELYPLNNGQSFSLALASSLVHTG